MAIPIIIYYVRRHPYYLEETAVSLDRANDVFERRDAEPAKPVEPPPVSSL